MCAASRGEAVGTGVRWACGACSWLRSVEQYMQDDGGQVRSITELHADTVEFLDGRRD